MEWRGTEAQVIQIPEHGSCMCLQSTPFATKFECELFDLPNIHTLSTRGVETLHWGTGQVVQITSPELLPPSLLCQRWATSHSLLPLVAQTVRVEDMCFHSSTCLPSAREIIIEVWAQHFYHSMLPPSQEVPAEKVQPKSCSTTGNVLSWWRPITFSEGNK